MIRDMSTIKHYGSTEDETNANKTAQCREIVREIMTFGVNQQQLLKIIGLLSLELENRDHLQQVSGLIKRLEEGDTTRSTLITEV